MNIPHDCSGLLQFGRYIDVLIDNCEENVTKELVLLPKLMQEKAHCLRLSSLECIFSLEFRMHFKLCVCI